LVSIAPVYRGRLLGGAGRGRAPVDEALGSAPKGALKSGP
jgi:hypothetical protein